MVDASDLIVIGKITAVFGIKGWVKIHSYTDPVENLLDYSSCFLESNKLWEPIEFEAAKFHGKGLVALIKGVSDRDQAQLYCQRNIAVLKSDMPPLAGDEYYLHQLEGLDVYAPDAEGQRLLLGKVHQMMETGANDVLVVHASAASIDDRERLIPWLPEQVIKLVDIEAGLIEVDWDPEF
ncbi:MAG: ribosome maturation factor RimM [Spongiibacteraceae bacterium]